MFPETQTTPAPTGAADPSFADIVREQTQGGRTIIRFFVDAMTGDLPNFKPCHRIDASGQLIKLQASTFAHIVLEYTDGGRLITQFLHEAMTGRLPDFEDCHQMAAGRLLAKVDPDMAQALTEDNTPQRSRPLLTDAAGAPSHACTPQALPYIPAPWAPRSTRSSGRRPTTAGTWCASTPTSCVASSPTSRRTRGWTPPTSS